MKVRFFSILGLMLTLSSCAGYHFNTNNNPLLSYDIHSVSVPMFINRSSIPELAAPMTREITFALNDYTGIKVFSGDNENADAVLIGIIDSRDHYNEVVKTSSQLFSDTTVKTSVGARSPFYYPVESVYDFSLKIILIKRPSKEELQLLTSDLGQFMKANPKVVLMDTLALSGKFSRVVGESTGPDSPGKTNFVKNRGLFEKSIQDTAVNAGKSFKQVVLNAF
jgi:hypothetical protein